MATFPTHLTHYYYHSSWLQLLRPMTLSGTISPICASTLLILWQTGSVQVIPFFLLLIGAVLIQMATNIWNDYFDFKKGQDQLKWQLNDDGTPHPTHGQLPVLAVILTVIAIASGLVLALLTTYWVIPIGIFGIVGGFYYSAGNHSLSQVGLGELTAAIFLGFATTLLAFIVQGTYLLPDMFLLAIPFALLISTMILTNNIRDIDKDHTFRKTIPIILKREKAILLLRLLLIVIYVWMIMLIWLTILPLPTLVIFVGLLFAYRLLKSFKLEKTDPACMKYAAWHHWSFGLSLMTGLAISLLINTIL